MSKMRIELTETELYTRGGVLDQLMESTCDAALLTDRNGRVLHTSNGGNFLRTLTTEESIGKQMHELNPDSYLIADVLRTGKAIHGAVEIVQGRKCLVNTYPIYSGQTLIGILATILFSSLTSLKKVFTQLTDIDSKESENMYNTLARMGTSLTFDDFIGSSFTTKKLISQCRRAANTHQPILLIGESGTGKEILANAIHSEYSGNLWKPFIKINCSAIPKDLLESELFGHEKGAFTGAVATKKGKFEMANGGSILLDEIAEMDMGLQSKLLRVLEEKEFERVGGTKMIPLNARIIASTNANLRKTSKEGKFRSDLYYRLSTLEINVPPLRSRKDDIPMLVSHILTRDNLNFTLTPEALSVFNQYDWPGNVRELRNIINRIGILCDESIITPAEVLPLLQDSLETDSFAEHKNTSTSLITNEIESIIEALKRNNFNISKTANEMGFCRTTLYNKMKKYNIQISN